MTERPDQPPITSPRSERVRTVAALTGRSARRKQNRFRVEGPQAVRSLLTHRPDLALELFTTARAATGHPDLPGLAADAGVAVHEVEDRILRAMVRETAPDADAPDADPPGAEAPDGAGALVSPQGVLAVGTLPAPDPAGAVSAIGDVAAGRPATVVVLHEVRDPGNVGTLIRTADAAGADLVVLTRTSADPYAPKAVRASVGSLFHLPVITGAESAELMTALAASNITAAATSGYARTELFAADLPERIAWILGNEAHGLDEDTLAAAPLAVRIPLAGRAESLNVHTAATVCLFETMRRRRAGA
ncbi:rRNA methyltransferase [Brachybacterium sp. P6-10-X1]|uniref:TrmH family RNA methyltransferase n=1 Tax=Brachybacterium sp. P6-10-X1 TaxID=1903186 RepID=UPI0009717CCF|nr:RNA methyltransferase [Brachybacterium sp. P6-10-X1]APX32534.1 rRNA methyltransferase [Brachybacterium sp. P6-10-X1]